ncbi:MAG: hypothetical protein EKK53_00840 [Burkholderiales bacterium]|nr:MAG: hypothetical protein EKK53_00840 [Burkholderiales bacterium]
MDRERHRIPPFVVAIDVAKCAKDLQAAAQLAVRSGADRIILIGGDEKLESVLAAAGHRVEVLPAGSKVPDGASEVQPPSEHPATSPEVDLFDVLLAKALAGEQIHIQGPMTGTVAMMHIATIERLKHETGKPVSVVYS